jgi:superfamily I DNA and RNA helicase
LKPTLIEIKDWNDQVTQIYNSIEKLVDKDKIAPKNIGIIYDFSIKTPDPTEDHLNLTKLLRSKFYVIDAEQYSLPYTDKGKENYITRDSINRFKGLEKTVIILTNLKKINRKTVKNLYTGLSRARAHLIVISNKEVINELNDLIK